MGKLRDLNTWFFVLCGGFFLLAAIRAFTIPLSHDEAATFFLYVQNNNYMPFYAFIYTNNHVLNSALTQFVYSLLGSHPFVLRLPSLLSLLVLMYGVWRMSNLFQSKGIKVLLLVLLLMMPGLFDFFSLSRGYSYSLAFFTLAITFFLEWKTTNSMKQLIGWMLCLQLAIAANLIFVTVTAVFLGLVVAIQFHNKELFKAKNILLHFLNGGLFLYWVAVSFLYRTAGVLDYGVGENYWKVTFQSLIWLLTGSEQWLVQALFLFVFMVLLVKVFVTIFQKGFKLAWQAPQVVLFILFLALLLAFKLQKLFLNVNYPEDRTGLFFYLLFAITFAFFIDSLPTKSKKMVGSMVVICLVFVFFSSLSIHNFTNYLYHTIPNKMYERLLVEQKGAEPFTIGGHRVREMDFAFLNYRHNAALNPMDEREEMQMNCDYYLANLDEAPCYDQFYKGIDTDFVWNRVLLKRKEPIKRELVYAKRQPTTFQNNSEFNEFWITRDTTLGKQPFEVRVRLTFDSVAAPLKASLVFSADDSTGTTFYRRILLNWLGDQLSGKTHTLILTGANFPTNITKAVVYLWNTEKKRLKVTLNEITIYRLHGKGVTYTVPLDYYVRLEAITKRVRL